jgi:imidazolonepropionase
MLRVIKKLAQNYPISIKATFLRCACIPWAIYHQGYIDVLIIILQKIHKDKLANYIDVFCETGYFTLPRETEQIILGNMGLEPKYM